MFIPASSAARYLNRKTHALLLAKMIQNAEAIATDLGADANITACVPWLAAQHSMADLKTKGSATRTISVGFSHIRQYIDAPPLRPTCTAKI